MLSFIEKLVRQPNYFKEKLNESKYNYDEVMEKYLGLKNEQYIQILFRKINVVLAARIYQEYVNSGCTNVCEEKIKEINIFIFNVFIDILYVPESLDFVSENFLVHFKNKYYK